MKRLAMSLLGGFAIPSLYYGALTALLLWTENGSVFTSVLSRELADTCSLPTSSIRLISATTRRPNVSYSVSNRL